MTLAVGRLEKLARTDEEKPAIDDIKGVADRYNSAIDVARKMVSDEKSPKEIDKVVKIVKIEDSPAFKAFEVVQANIDNHETAAALSMKKTTRTLFIIVLTTTACLLLFILGYIFILHDLIKRLSFMGNFARNMVAGDLTVSSGITGKDELSVIAWDFDEMAENLRQMFGGIGENATKVDDAASQLSSISGSMSSGASGVSDRSNMVAAAAEEMISNLNSVAAAVEQASINIGTVHNSSGAIASTIREITESWNIGT